MPKVGCMSSSSLNNTWHLFVHLYPCKRQPVWFSVRPEERGWFWVTTDNPRNNAALLKLPGTNTRYVSRTLFRGYYLPGWWRPDGEHFRAVDPVTSKATKCTSGEFLALSSFSWISYTAGDPVPDCALSVSRLPGGTPLYIVRHQYIYYGREEMSGFYNPVAKTTYFVRSVAINPTVVDILCGMVTWNTMFKVSLYFACTNARHG